MKYYNLKELAKKAEQCVSCKLCQTRKNVVFGAGNPEANWMFVGEGPGATEDEQGLPFVGKAGGLLTQLIKEAGFSREEVYIANVVKCRPPENRDPEKDEIEACRPYLWRQIELINPAVITTLGKPAANLLLNTKEAMGKLRGREIKHELGPIVIPTYHPSYIQRGNWKALDLMRKDFALALTKIVEYL